jgi:hypothetical protein
MHRGNAFTFKRLVHEFSTAKVNKQTMHRDEFIFENTPKLFFFLFNQHMGQTIDKEEYIGCCSRNERG